MQSTSGAVTAFFFFFSLLLTIPFISAAPTRLPSPFPRDAHIHTTIAAAVIEAKATICSAIPPLSTTTPNDDVSRLNLVNRPDLHLPPQTQTLAFVLPSPLPVQGPCTLRARFPPHWEVFDSSVEAGGPPLAVNVYDLDGPAAGALVGVVRFAAAGGGEEETHEWEEEQERVVTVNSFACREKMAYRFELAGVGEVGFVNGFDAGLGVNGGLEIVYGC